MKTNCEKGEKVTNKFTGVIKKKHIDFTGSVC